MERLFLIFFVTASVVSVASAQPAVLRLPPVPLSAVAPEVPAPNPDPSFPLRVHLLTARFGGLAGRYHGYGSGNLTDTNGTAGFDFGFECDVPFVENEKPEETYQARWSSWSRYQLEILTAEVGTTQPRERTCTLRVAFERKPFEPANTAALSHGVSSSLRKRWQDPDFAYEEPQLDYPIQFHVVDGLRDEDAYQDHGWGTANLSEPGMQAAKGADYTYDCSYGFLTNAQLTSYYQARWVTPGSKLEVLLQRPGSEKVDRCTVQVDLKAQPYPQSRRIKAEALTSSAAAVGRAGP